MEHVVLAKAKCDRRTDRPTGDKQSGSYVGLCFAGATKIKMLLSTLKIVAAFRGMHVSPAKHSYASVTDRRTDGRTDRRTDRQTDGRTDGQTTDKVIPMCRYASQATQKLQWCRFLLKCHDDNC